MRPILSDPALKVMNFLNEAVARYPSAISFAPGRPVEALFDASGSLAEIDRYVDSRAATTSMSRQAILDSLGQYGRTKGIISDLIAQHLRADEQIFTDEENILVTNGAQEAMTLVLLALFEPAERSEVLLVSEPNYIGITGMAAILGIEVVPIPANDDGTDLVELERTIERVKRDGKQPRAFYDIPDFHNPLGARMPLAARKRLLAIAERHALRLLEDNAYGMFAYDGDRAPTLRALDTRGLVLYFGTFSKVLFPGLRVGYVVTPDKAQADALSAVKSLTTVNTSPLMQAVVGGLLLRSGGSLAGLCREKVAFYKSNRDRMLDALDRNFGRMPGVRWNRPSGGFFLTLSLPFEIGEAELVDCAERYGVIFCPMAFFSLTDQRRRQARLSFSYVSHEQIDEGVSRLASFVRERAGVGR